ncbi:hypothetical protein [Caballeronia sp. BR00000012568055]|uniref:hypothetical protein n=1 Tax=Caballeronia sp. BR00000012568055 TaxID=2918761 RepID=UPI0023F758EA|nr:hypothetical protein [Caballeronia sp. BR00000012568055]
MHRRKILTSALAGLGAMTLAACGGDSSSDLPASVADRAKRKGSSSTPASSTTAASPPAAASSTTAASSGNETVLTDTSFGVKGDGTTNDRVALQNAIDGSVGKVLLITGKSRIDVKGLDLRTNTHIRFATGASIKLLAHNSSSYQMMRIWDVSNVVVENAYLDGSKELNSATNNPNGDANGVGFSICGASNVTLTAPTTISMWGDGIYLANSWYTVTTPPSNVTVTNHVASGCRRQGVSITSGKNITFQSPNWSNISGSLPCAGLDIEPDNNNAVLQNISIVSPVTNNCQYGVLIYLGALAGPNAQNISITITNHHDTGARHAGMEIGGGSWNGYSVKGNITVTSPTYTKAAYGYELDTWQSGGPTISVTNITQN